MAQKTISKFSGGISSSLKSGLPNSFRFAKHLDIFSDDDSVTLLPKPVKDSGSVVNAVVRCMVTALPYSTTDRWAYDHAGHIYSITSNTWTDRHTNAATTAQGQGLLVFQNYLYYAASTAIGRGGLLSAGAAAVTYNDDYLNDGVFNLDLSETASGQTYAVPAAISETSVNRQTIVPTKDPLKTIQVYVSAKGTGNWTVTLHDVNNVNLGAATVANASLTNSAMNSFSLTTAARINIGDSYHFHVTSTVADGTLQTGTVNDLETAQFKTFFGILIADDDFHPMVQHTNGVGGTVIIGNNNYLAELVPGVSYDPNKIQIEPGFSIRGITRENEFIVAYARKGTDATTFDEGRLYYWDGIQPYYNYSKPVEAGVPNAILNYKNRLLSVVGSKAILTLGTEPFKTIQSIPSIPRGKTIEVLPTATAVYQNRAHIGVGAFGTATSGLIQGVYEFGNQSDRAVSYTSVSSEVLNFAYSISPGDETGIVMAIGCVASFGSDLYISWESEAATYGVDRVSIGNDPAATGSYESLIDDDVQGKQGFSSMPQHQKESQRLIIRYLTLPTGCTVTPKYKLDRAASWSYGTGTDIGVAGSTFCVMDINQRYYEIEYGFDLVATTGYPTILSLTHEFDSLLEETNPPY